MNRQPVLNVPGSSSSGSSKKSASASGQTTGGRYKSNVPNPYHKARRRRAASRQKRRFEALFARLPRPTHVNLRLQGIAIPAVVLPTPWAYSKVLSLLLVLGALFAFTLLNTGDDWFVYREDVRFQNLIRMQGDELYRLLDLEGLNVFWIEPEEIRAKLLTLPWVEDAQVAVSLPGSVYVNVTELTPAAVWVTNGGNYWLAANGSALPIATLEESALPELALPQIIDSLQEARVVGEGPLAIDTQVLNSALTLMAAMPELNGTVRYNESTGLNFPLPEPAVWVYWGDGFDVDAKLENLAVARDLVRKAETPAQIVDVRLIDRPYVR
jgi:cell division septal protein FtsQ